MPVHPPRPHRSRQTRAVLGAIIDVRKLAIPIRRPRASSTVPPATVCLWPQIAQVAMRHNVAVIGDGRMAYDGFISYSHAADGRLAPALQRGLEQLAKRWNSRRALRAFRDDTGLSTNPHLWAAIERALDDSAWFVLLASPEAAASEWVDKEVAHWLATRSVERLLPVVTDGTWEWDQAAGGFTLGSSAVPAALRAAVRDEPRHLDLRWARGRDDLDLRNSRFLSLIHI